MSSAAGAGRGFGDNHTIHLIVVITNDVRVFPSANLNIRGQLQIFLYIKFTLFTFHCNLLTLKKTIDIKDRKPRTKTKK
jgi:hypothetical protein